MPGEAFLTLEMIGIPQTVDILLKAEKLARQLGRVDIGEECHAITIGLLRDVNDAAVKIAGMADGMIIGKILESRHSARPASGDMESHIKSEPGPFGLVLVALKDELDKIINPAGYDTFWRAQEYGTGQDGVPTQVGRPLWGGFSPSGSTPDSAQRGLGKGRDVAFIPGQVPVGFGRISVDLPPRHFLTDGSAMAATEYETTMNAILAKWNSAMAAVFDEAKAIQAQRSTEYIINF